MQIMHQTNIIVRETSAIKVSKEVPHVKLLHLFI